MYASMYFEAEPHYVTLSLSQYVGQALLELRDLPDTAPKCWDQRLVTVCPVRIVSQQIPSSSSVVAPDLPQTVLLN